MRHKLARDNLSGCGKVSGLTSSSTVTGLRIFAN